MTTLPPLPAENEDPWFEKRQAFDLAVKALLEGGSSPETITGYFAQALKFSMFNDIGDLLVGSSSDGSAADILPRGLDGQILQVNTLKPLGLEWSDRLSQAQTAAQEAIDMATEALIENVRSVVTEYAVNSSETVAPTTGWSTDQPTRTPGTFIWGRTITTKGPDGEEVVTTSAPYLLTGNTGATGSTGPEGPEGPQGPPGDQGIQGPPGADGTPRYMWLKYADTPTTGMSDSPTGKSYIGVAYNKTTPTESTNYADYEWTLFKGPQGDEGPEGPQGVPGIQGPPGDDGQPTYTWIKYADNASGSGMSDSPTGKTYIGLAHNKTTPTESTNPADYTWALFQGPQGVPGTPGADGTPRYIWLKYADTPTTGMSDSPTGKTYMGIAYNKTTPTESTNYADYQWSLIKGAQGDQGIQGPPGDDGQPTYTWIKYATNASGGGMSDDPTGKTYIGLAYNKLTPTESTNPADYQWALFQGPQGPTGDTGPQGPTGSAGKGIASTEIRYQVGSSGTTAPTGTWQTTPQTTSPGQFHWTRVVLTFTDSSTSTAYTVAAHGATGATGSTGAAGKGISSTEIRYQVGSSATTAPTGTWQTTPQATSAGQYLWTRTVITYTDSTTSTSYAVSAHGATGSAGKGISSTEIRYQVGSSGTSAPTGTWQTTPQTTSPGQFHWTRTVVTYTDSTTSTSYAVAAHGATGSTGATGVSISSITPYFLLQGAGGSTPAKPTTNPPGGSWSLTEPAYLSSTELFRTELILFSNSTFAYTNVSKVSSYTASTQAVTAANLAQAAAEGMVKASVTDPGHQNGRIWLQLNGSGNTIGIKISNGSSWSSYALMADQVLVPSSVGPTQIADGAITTVKLNATAINGMTITGATFQTTATAARGVKIDSSGFKAYNNSGTETVSINGTTGAVVITGTINATAGTFSGSITLTGTITASGATAATPGFYVNDTSTNMQASLRPRGLEFVDPSGPQTIRISTRKVSTGDPLTPGVIAMALNDSTGSRVLEISQFSVGGNSYGAKFEKRVLFQQTPIIEAGASAGHLAIRSGTSNVYPVRGFYTAGHSGALPPGSSTNILDNDFAFTAYNSASGRGPNQGMYAMEGSSWKLVDLWIKPAFRIHGTSTLGGSGAANQSLVANTWQMMNVVWGSASNAVVNRWFNYSNGMLTAKEAGLYLVSAGANFASLGIGTSARLALRIMKNSTDATNTAAVVGYSINDDRNYTGTASFLVPLEVGDVLRCYAWIEGVNGTLESMPWTHFQAVWHSPLT